jgi:hypothetical protein
MSKPVSDVFTTFRSAVRFEPKSNLRFIAEELRRYGIKTNQKNDKGKVVFYQSVHIIVSYELNQPQEEGVILPAYALVNFKDLFTAINKADGVDDQDIVRTFEIASKLEKRSIIDITGTAAELLDKDEEPNIPDIFANFAHVYKNDEEKGDIVYKSKFATNKAYNTRNGKKLLGVSDFFVLA